MKRTVAGTKRMLCRFDQREGYIKLCTKACAGALFSGHFFKCLKFRDLIFSNLYDARLLKRGHLPHDPTSRINHIHGNGRAAIKEVLHHLIGYGGGVSRHSFFDNPVVQNDPKRLVLLSIFLTSYALILSDTGQIEKSRRGHLIMPTVAQCNSQNVHFVEVSLPERGAPMKKRLTKI